MGKDLKTQKLLFSQVCDRDSSPDPVTTPLSSLTQEYVEHLAHWAHLYSPEPALVSEQYLG